MSSESVVMCPISQTLNRCHVDMTKFIIRFPVQEKNRLQVTSIAKPQLCIK